MEPAQPHLDPDEVDLPAFGLAEDLPALDGDWHTHARPQLLYATSGAMRLYTGRRIAVLPPQRAAWIPGGVAHRVQCGRPVQLRTVYFPAGNDGELVVFEAPPLLREMAREACEWGLSPPETEAGAAFFVAFEGLVSGWRASALTLSLPAATTPALQRGLDHLLARLGRPVGLADAAKAAGMSPRTLQRRCKKELGVGLSEWLQQARVLRALELLADPEVQIGEVALRCGYQSQAAFTRVFQRRLGVAPSVWRRG